MKTRVIVAVIAAVVLCVAPRSWAGREQPGSDDMPLAAPALPATSDALPGACDGQPKPPPLPATLSPATPDLAGVLAALDASLASTHKTFIRCFVDDDELLGRLHQGLGRWLRTVLRLRRPSPLGAALASAGARGADEASSVIVLAYAHHLRGETLTADVALARVRATRETIGGAR